MAEPSTPRQTGCSIDELLHHLWNANRNARRRCRQLVAQLREARVSGPQALVQLEQRRVAEQEQWQAELAAVKKDRAQLADSDLEQSNRVRQFEQQLAECEQRLTTLQVELDTAQESTVEANCRFEHLQNQHNETLGELELACRQLEEMALSVHCQAGTFQEGAAQDEPRNGQRSQMRANPITVPIIKESDVSTVCDNSVDEAISRISQLACLDEVDATAAPGQGDANPQETQPIAPTSFIEQYADIVEENIENEGLSREDAADQSQRSSQRTQATVAMPASAHDPVVAPVGTADDHTSVLETYMTGLLNRVCGVGQQESTSALSPEHGQESFGQLEPQQPDLCSEADLETESDLSGSTVESTVAAARPQEDVQQERATWLELDDLKQSSDKPELPTDLGALRHLANNSARKAIADYGAHRYRSIAIGKLLACFAAAISATFLMWWSEQPDDGAFIGGCVAVTIGLIWACQLLHVLLKVVRSGSWDEEVAVD